MTCCRPFTNFHKPEGGDEAAIHAMKDLFQVDGIEEIVLVFASNAFTLIPLIFAPL